MYYNDYNRPPEEQDIIETYGYRVSEPIPEPPRKSKGLAAKFVAVGLCCALIGGLAGGVGGWALGGMRGTTTIYQSDRAPTVVNIANVKDRNLLTVPEVYATNVNSTVGISGNVATNVWGQTVRNAVSGSGFIITQDGYILTNYHVIDGVSDIKVTLYDGSTYDAKLVGGEEENDIAVLKVEAQGLTPVVIGKSSDLHVGDQVVAIGNPLGELTFTLTGGYVSAMDRSITMSDGSMMNMIQTDTAINSGNSGGPLFNLYGEVVGITTAKLSSSNSSSASVEGLGFAIPIDDVVEMVSDIMEHGYVTGKPNVGILLEEVSGQAIRYGIPQGAYVSGVLSGAAGDKAGLQAGDIITAVDSEAVTSVSALQDAVKRFRAGDSAQFTVYRDGEDVTLNITFDESSQQRQQDLNDLRARLVEEQQAQREQENQQNGYFSWPFGW